MKETWKDFGDTFAVFRAFLPFSSSLLFETRLVSCFLKHTFSFQRHDATSGTGQEN